MTESSLAVGNGLFDPFYAERDFVIHSYEGVDDDIRFSEQIKHLRRWLFQGTLGFRQEILFSRSADLPAGFFKSIPNRSAAFIGDDEYPLFRLEAQNVKECLPGSRDHLSYPTHGLLLMIRCLFSHFWPSNTCTGRGR